MFRFFSLCFLISCKLFCQEYSPENLRKEADEKLESAFEKTTLGALEVGIGVWRAFKGDILNAAIVTSDGVNTLKNGILDFQEAKDLFNQARDMEIDYDRFDLTPGCHDREY